MITQKQIKKIETAGCVAVILAESIGAVAVVRALGMKNIPCIVIGNEFHHKSRYTTVSLKAETKEEVVKLLVLIPGLVNLKPVLFTDADEYLDVILSNWSNLKNNYYIPSSPNNYLLIDKDKLEKAKNIRDISTLPVSFEKINDIEEHHYPVIIKPLWHDRRFSELERRPEKAYICNDNIKVKEVDRFLTNLGIPYVAQQMIEGPANTIYAALLYRSTKGKVEVGYTGKKLRNFPLDYGVGSAFIAENNSEIINRSIALMELTDYHGIADFEYKFCEKTSEYYLIEVNGRFSLQTSLIQQTNPHFIYTIFCDMTNRPKRESVSKKSMSNIIWLFLLMDIRAIRGEKGKSIFMTYLSIFFSYRIQGALWSFSDPLPAIYFLKYIMRKVIMKPKEKKPQHEKKLV